MPSRAMLLACALAPTASSALAQEAVTPAEASAIATDAYVYGYPLITMDTTRRVMTNTARPEGTHAPMGQFANVRAYPDAAFRDVTAPNADTLYSIAWLDLATEPYVVSIPDEDGRYFLMPMLSGWTDVFAAPGKRTTGTKAQTYAVTGPNWSGTLPEGMKELKSPTAMVWIVARTYCTGTPEDYEAVHAIQDAYKLVPLSAYGKPYTPPTGKVDPAIDMKTPVRAQVNGMKAGEYFSLLAKLMADNPPAEADAAIVARMARIGIVPGEAFDPSKLPAEVADRDRRRARRRLEGDHGPGADLDHPGERVELVHQDRPIPRRLRQSRDGDGHRPGERTFPRTPSTHSRAWTATARSSTGRIGTSSTSPRGRLRRSRGSGRSRCTTRRTSSWRTP